MSQDRHRIFRIYISSHDLDFLSKADAVIDLTHTDIHADISDLSEVFPSGFEDNPIGRIPREAFGIAERYYGDTTTFTGFPRMIVTHSIARSDIVQSHHSRTDSHRRLQFFAEHICFIVRIQRIVAKKSDTGPIGIEEIVSDFHDARSIPYVSPQWRMSAIDDI